MKQSKKKKFQWQQWLGMGIFMLIGAVCGFWMVYFLEQNAAADRPLHIVLLSLAGILLGIYVGIFLQLIIHEAGHLVFGLRSGYRFSSFRIGSFMWLKDKDRIVLRKLSIAGTGGQCLMVPPEMTDGKIPVVLYNLGGCILNLIASGICFLLYLLIGGGSWISAFLVMMAVIGVVIAMMNGIPLRLGAVDNDGRNALSLGKNKDAMYAFWMQLKVNEQIARGVRLKDMPDAWFWMPTDAAMRNSMVAAQGVFACNRMMDRQRFDEADRQMAHLLQIESGINGLHRSLLICDRMYCELIGENRPEVLAGLYTGEQKKFMKSMRKFPSVIRTEYAYALLAQKNTASADASMALFDTVAKTYPYPSDIQSERQLMEIARTAT